MRRFTIQRTDTNKIVTLWILCQHENNRQVHHRTWHHSPHDRSPTSRFRCKAMQNPFWPLFLRTCVSSCRYSSPSGVGLSDFDCLLPGQRNGFANLLRNVTAINKRPRREQPPYKSLQPPESLLQPPNTLLITAFGGSPLVRSSKLTFSTNSFLSLPTTPHFID